MNNTLISVKKAWQFATMLFLHFLRTLHQLLFFLKINWNTSTNAPTTTTPTHKSIKIAKLPDATTSNP